MNMNVFAWFVIGAAVWLSLALAAWAIVVGGGMPPLDHED
jgi:hypothetical protein